MNECVCMREREKQKLLKVNVKKLALYLLHAFKAKFYY